MFSEVTFLVENGEDTDRLNDFLSHVIAEYDSAHAKSYPGRVIVLDYTVKVDVKDVPAKTLREGMTVIGKNGAEATVHSVSLMVSRVRVELDTEFGNIIRDFDYDETVTVK